MSENELKFVIGGYVELEAELTSSHGWDDITQGYLNPNARVRSRAYQDGRRSFYFTYKQRMPNGHNLELEAIMAESEFNEAWEYTVERLTKRRVSFDDGDVHWDIDFYRWAEPYFVLAEVEMPAAMVNPESIPPILAERMIYAVPREDNRFTARLLADEVHVRAMAQELGIL